jgi:hypothetical protein
MLTDPQTLRFLLSSAGDAAVAASAVCVRIILHPLAGSQRPQAAGKKHDKGLYKRGERK